MRLHLAQAFSNRAPRGRKHDFKDAERLVRRLRLAQAQGISAHLGITAEYSLCSGCTSNVRVNTANYSAYHSECADQRVHPRHRVEVHWSKSTDGGRLGTLPISKALARPQWT
jgi:hypothetical protein